MALLLALSVRLHGELVCSLETFRDPIPMSISGSNPWVKSREPGAHVESKRTSNVDPILINPGLLIGGGGPSNDECPLKPGTPYQ